MTSCWASSCCVWLSANHYELRWSPRTRRTRRAESFEAEWCAQVGSGEGRSVRRPGRSFEQEGEHALAGPPRALTRVVPDEAGAGRPHRRVRGFAIRVLIEEQHDAPNPASTGEHAQLVQRSAIVRVETAQVHEHHIGVRHQPVQRLLPGRIEAVELVDAKAPVGVGGEIERPDTLGEGRLTANEALVQPAGDEGEQLLWLES